MRTIAIINLKGGVGKTTVALNLAAALHILGKKVLLVDFDPNHDLSENLGVNPFSIIGIEYFIIGASTFNTVKKEFRHGFDFIPSGIKLKDLELSLSGNGEDKSNRFFCLRNSFKYVPDHYDYVIFDCPPFGGVLTTNVLAYVDKIVIPVQCQYLGLKGAKRTMVFSNKIKNLYNSNLKIEIIIPTFYDSRNKLSDFVLEQILKTFKNLVSETVIHSCISLAESPGYKRTIFDHAPKSRSSQNFIKIAQELMLKEVWDVKHLNIEVDTDIAFV